MHSDRKSLRRDNDLAWIGRWNGRNHGGLENASAPMKKWTHPGTSPCSSVPPREKGISLSEESLSSISFPDSSWNPSRISALPSAEAFFSETFCLTFRTIADTEMI